MKTNNKNTIKALCALFVFLILLTASCAISHEPLVDNTGNAKNTFEKSVVTEMDRFSLLLDCPPGIDKSEPARIAVQTVNNVFYKWHEYNLSEEGHFCIVLIEPNYKLLSAAEAQEFLKLIAELEGLPSEPDGAETLEPDDPELDLPTKLPDPAEPDQQGQSPEEENKPSTDEGYSLEADDPELDLPTRLPFIEDNSGENQ